MKLREVKNKSMLRDKLKLWVKIKEYLIKEYLRILLAAGDRISRSRSKSLVVRRLIREVLGKGIRVRRTHTVKGGMLYCHMTS
jgi:hypothetical protein